MRRLLLLLDVTMLLFMLLFIAQTNKAQARTERAQQETKKYIQTTKMCIDALEKAVNK